MSGPTNFLIRQSKTLAEQDWAWQTRPEIRDIAPGSLLSISATSTANTDGTSNSTHKATPLVELDGIPAPQVVYRADGTTVTLPDAHGVIYYKDDAKTVKAEKVENLAPGEKLKLTAAPELGYRFKLGTFSYEDQVRTIQAPVTPQKPGFDPKTGELTITEQTGVEYTIADHKAVSQKVAPGASVTVQAKPAADYVFATGADKEWTFTADKATKPLELTVHYKRTDAAYNGYKLHSWLNEKDAPEDTAFDGQDPATATRTLSDVTDAEKLGVIVYKLADNGKDWIKNTEPDVFVDLAQAKDGKLEIWIRQSDPKVYYSLQDMKDRVTKPETKEVAGEWADVAFNLDTRKVSQERSVTTTEYVWSDKTWSYEPVASTKKETQTRDLTEAEAKARTLLPGTTVAPGEWTDISFDVAKREVIQERDVLTTKYAWSSEKWTYVPTSSTSKETQTRPMTSDEAKDRTPSPPTRCSRASGQSRRWTRKRRPSPSPAT
ncbi:hypothetical protein INS90_03340 [Trueperella pecoris]|uniref:Pullulanase carbohydrate-binding module 41 domain-containing protein n=1 Tax=Trueperella pecoris TaxID=2733571 RepID=A0A7M1R3R8_9ACTO|nr:pullulanase-associated domain-containing protein [Trueperella pecoris]QOR48324.1 hypothetical protein INS90_03340 [Trueperella pecoris]